MNRYANKRGAVIMAAIIIALVAATARVESAYALGEDPVSIQQETITVSCYKGNLEAGNLIGNLSVTSPQNAGRRCNSTYYDCEGQCLGCFTGPNGTQVCYDNEGQKVKK